VNRANPNACLVVGAHVAEVRLEQVHLETLRTQLPGVLADVGVLDAVDEREADAGSRAEELEKYLRDQAGAAERTGECERAGGLRGMADRLKAALAALDSAVSAVEDAALVADRASEDAKRVLDDVNVGKPGDRENDA
jgi:hypothetical protein